MSTTLGRALRVRTIWAPGVFGVPPDRYANLYRVVLPLFYLAMLWAGVGGLTYGAPAFADFTNGGQVISLWWGGWTTLWALTCFVGVVIPKWFWAEAVGAGGIVASISVYLLTLLLLTSSGSTARWVAAGVSVAALLLAAFRLGDLRVEVRTRRRQHETATGEMTSVSG